MISSNGLSQRELKSIKAGKTIWVVFKTVQHVYQRMQLRIFPIYCLGRPQVDGETVTIPVRRDYDRHGLLKSFIYRTFYADGKLAEGETLLRLGPSMRDIFGIYDTYRKAVCAAVLKCEEEAVNINKLPYDLRTWWYLDQPSLTGREHSRYTTGKSRLERHESIMTVLREITAKIDSKGQERYINHILRENKFSNLPEHEKFFEKTDNERIDTGFYFANGKPMAPEGFKCGDISMIAVGIGGSQRGKSMLNEHLAQEAEKRGITVIRHKPRIASGSEPKVVLDYSYDAFHRSIAEEYLKSPAKVLFEFDVNKIKPENEDKDEPTPPSP